MLLLNNVNVSNIIYGFYGKRRNVTNFILKVIILLMLPQFATLQVSADQKMAILTILSFAFATGTRHLLQLHIHTMLCVVDKSVCRTCQVLVMTASYSFWYCEKCSYPSKHKLPTSVPKPLTRFLMLHNRSRRCGTCYRLVILSKLRQSLPAQRLWAAHTYHPSRWCSKLVYALVTQKNTFDFLYHGLAAASTRDFCDSRVAYCIIFGRISDHRFLSWRRSAR